MLCARFQPHYGITGGGTAGFFLKDPRKKGPRFSKFSPSGGVGGCASGVSFLQAARGAARGEHLLATCVFAPEPDRGGVRRKNSTAGITYHCIYLIVTHPLFSPPLRGEMSAPPPPGGFFNSYAHYTPPPPPKAELRASRTAAPRRGGPRAPEFFFSGGGAPQACGSPRKGVLCARF